MLCASMQAVLEDVGLEFGSDVVTIKDILKVSMIYSRERSFTLIFDEFQELYYVNPAAYAGIQEIWDRYHSTSHLNLIVTGSVHSIMKRIFEDEKAPLFARPTCRIEVRPFPIALMKQILGDHNGQYTNRDLLMFFLLTEGVPYYVSILMDAGSTSSDLMLNAVISENSVFLNDGKNTLVSEFGKEYNTYFSVLGAIAAGHERRSEIDNVIGAESGPYLDRLQKEYGFIKQISPILSKPGSRNSKWVFSDLYLRFYFRFILPNASYIEGGRFDLLRRYVLIRLDEYEGRALEDYFRRRIIEERTYTEVGGWWSRDGQAEIDIVVIDSFERKAEMIEVKRDPRKYRESELVLNSRRLSEELAGYDISYRCLSLNDM